MLQVEAGSVLIRLRKRQQLRLAIELTKEGQAHGSSRTADPVILTIVVARRLGRIWTAKSVGQDHRWMAGEIGSNELLAIGWRNDYIQVLEELPPELHCLHTGAIGLNVLDRRRESRNAKQIWPVI